MLRSTRRPMVRHPLLRQLLLPQVKTLTLRRPGHVKGICPARFMVKIYRNDVFSGGILCAMDNTFQLQTDLFVGSNILKARVFNAVGDEGPLPRHHGFL